MADADAPAQRFVLVDLAKVVAAQIIVLHHFSAYGPLSQALHQAWPEVFNWLFGYGRMAVQVFLVVGGYLAAKSLSSHASAWQTPWATIPRRFVRLIGPYLVALGGAVLCAVVARGWLTDAFVPHAPSLSQWLAHMALLQGLLGFDGLSAGVWYVAIDFQLYTALALVLWAARGITFAGKLAVLAFVGASFCLFNRNPDWDNWAVYFFGAYGLGALAWWAAHTLSDRWARYFFVVALALAATSLAVDFRARVALACCTAALLWWFHPDTRTGVQPLPTRAARGLTQLGQHAYALFLVHFSVLLLTNVLYSLATTDGHDATRASGATALLFLTLGWGFSMALAAVFFQYIERPLAVWQGTPSSGKRAPKR